MVAPLRRNDRVGILLVLVRLPNVIPLDPDLVIAHRIPAHFAYRHFPITRPTHTQPLRHVERRLGRP